MKTLRERKRKGLTLIELLIVITFIGILAAIAIPTFLEHRKSSQAEKPAVKLRPAVKLGIEVLVEEKRDLIWGKRVGLVTNPTGVDSNLCPSADRIALLPGVELKALFGPEHGIRGGVHGTVEGSKDPKTGIIVYSLYGKTRKPTPEMLKNIDVLIFDIQDIGTRSYTYISTMYYCMEAAAEHKIKFIVLDRPNPIGGWVVGGPVLDPEFKSFIGIAPIAYVHGMTIGELATYFNKECEINCDLKVVKMQGWKRDMAWRNTGLVWTPTSPHVPEMDTALFLPITGIMGELPIVNIGVGYTLPFKLVGAPWINAEEFSKTLNALKLSGVYFQPMYFKPYYLHHKGELCQGVRVIITDERTIKPVAVGYYIMGTLMKMYPDKFNFKLESVQKRKRMFDLANGTNKIRFMLEKGVPAEKIVQSYQRDLEQFKKKRKKYLFYD